MYPVIEEDNSDDEEQQKISHAMKEKRLGPIANVKAAKQKRKVSDKRKTANTDDTGGLGRSTTADGSSFKQDDTPTVKLTKELLLAFEE